MKKIILCILCILILLFLIVAYFPIRFSIKGNSGIRYSDFEEVYIITESDTTGASWVADRKENNTFENIYFLMFNGKKLEEFLPNGIDLGDDQGITSDNKFVIYGKKNDYDKALGSYSFNLEKWDIMYPIKRKPTIYALIANDSYITLMDYIL